MKKLNLDKVKEMAGKVLPKKSDEPEAALDSEVEAAAEAAPNKAAEAINEAEAAVEQAAETETPPKAQQTAKAKPMPSKISAKATEILKKCKFRLPAMDQFKDPAFIAPIAAFLLLILAWCFTKNTLVRSILGGLSAIAALYALFPDILKAVKSKDWRSGLLLVVLAAILYALVGGIPGAATALLLWLAGQKALDCLKQMKQDELAARRNGSPLRDELPAFDAVPVFTDDKERNLQAYFAILAVFLAAVVAILAALTRAGFTGALRRAAAILVLGSTASFFAGFPFGDMNSLIAAAQNGVLFRGSALRRALKTKLCCVSEAEPEMFGDVAVYSAVPDKLTGEALLKLAALAYSQSESPWAAKLASVCEIPAAEGLEIHELEGFGIAAKLKQLTYLCGSAEFMAKAELPLLPFRTGENVIHIGVSNFYAGCLELTDTALDDDAVDAALAENGFFRFDNAEDVASKRQSGECVLFAAPNGKPDECGEGDLYAASGAYQTDADVVLGRYGVSGILDLAAELKKAGTLRKLLLRLALYVKAILFLLAVFGACPLWLAVTLELGLSAFGVCFGAKAPKAKG